MNGLSRVSHQPLAQRPPHPLSESLSVDVLAKTPHILLIPEGLLKSENQVSDTSKKCHTGHALQNQRLEETEHGGGVICILNSDTPQSDQPQ